MRLGNSGLVKAVSGGADLLRSVPPEPTQSKPESPAAEPLPIFRQALRSVGGTERDRREDFQNVGQRKSLRIEEGVAAPVEEHRSGQTESFADALIGVGAEKGRGTAAIGDSPGIENPAERTLSCENQTPPRFWKTLQVNPGRSELDGLPGVLQLQGDHPPIDAVLSSTSQSSKADSIAMVGLEGAGHVAVMDQQAAIRLRDLGARQDLQAG